MSKKLYIANWKSHKTKEDALQFFEDFKEGISKVDLTDKEIIIAPPFTLLAKAHYLIEKYNLPMQIAAQNVSSFPEGAYTGEISARQVKEFAKYVIVGHSERRKYLHESDTDIENKVREAMEEGLEIIQCIQDEESVVHSGAKYIAYEPPSSIGSGNPDSPEHIEEVFKAILTDNPHVEVIYGGSVTPENFGQFLSIETLSGFLIGGASLEANSFIQLLS